MCSIITMLLTCCQQSADDSSQRADGLDTVYTEPKAMSIHRTQPERALVMIDSAVIVGSITPTRGEYLKAITQYGGLNNYHLARQTCLNVLNAIDQKANSKASSQIMEADAITILRIYQLLTSIEYTSGNTPAVIRYATEASRLAHEYGDFRDLADSEGHIAEALAGTGKTDEGIERLKPILDELREDDSFHGVVNYHTVTMRLLHILIENNRLTEIVPVCEAMLKRVRELRDHPDRFSGIAEDFDTSEFTDLAQGHALVYLTAAYARLANTAGDGMRPQYMAQARAAEADLRSLPWSQTMSCERMMSGVYHYLGDFERFDKAMALIAAKMGDDTINVNNFIRLTSCCVAAKMRGRLSEAIEYLERASIVRDSLDARNQREQLNELATVYHLQEEQLARKEAEADARFFRLLTIAIIAGLLAAIAFAVYFFYKRRQTNKKNHVLAREIAEAIKYKEMWEKSQTVSPTPAEVTSPSSNAEKPETPGLSLESTESEETTLFNQLRDAILRDQLYLDPQLDRQALVERFNVPKERIGSAFSKGSPFKSLIDFLTDCRLPYAAKLLAEHPDLSIGDVARQSGFSSADTFSRNFRQKYALTPSQYREQQDNMT
ncbi:MAG: helix-turn-helix domain-containing protein [Prevotella sp.]|nr:helix-turn-helix domain-containing protein [Prevotella sp.]